MDVKGTSFRTKMPGLKAWRCRSLSVSFWARDPLFLSLSSSSYKRGLSRQFLCVSLLQESTCGQHRHGATS